MHGDFKEQIKIGIFLIILESQHSPPEMAKFPPPGGGGEFPPGWGPLP